MALAEQLWSLNALSTELGIDRRTLGKKLADLPPAEQTHHKTRVEKKWHLKDVVAHLGRPKSRRSSQPAPSIEDLENDPKLLAETTKMLQKFVGAELFPKLCDCPAFSGFIVNAVIDEFGLSAKQGLRIYQLVCLAIIIGICDGFSDENMDFQMPEFFEALRDGIDAVAAGWKFPPAPE
jgi:hypothetical protein